MAVKRKWWQEAVFYQIYPRSFADSNGDGVGDFDGMRAKLGYLKSLGIGAIWLSPHYPSPMVDCGYDVSDYCDVAPEYGGLESFQRFLADAHAHGIRVILDLVLNHTSDQHRWFQESRKDQVNPKRDWYIWKPGRNGGPPNDWVSAFGGPAWEFDQQTGEYYYHYFFKEQPDLNWDLPEVQAAMWDVVRFWLKMGVDGFRLDAVGTIFEVEDWRDNCLNFGLDDIFLANRTAETDEQKMAVAEKWNKLFANQVDQPRLHGLMKSLRKVVDEFEDRVLLGEAEDLALYGNGMDELHMVFNFPLLEPERLTAGIVAQNQNARLPRIPEGGWAANTLGNHDSPRMFNRFGDGTNSERMARLHLLLMLTLQGTPVLYYGEEIGMTDWIIQDVARLRDSYSLGYFEMEKRIMGSSEEVAATVAASAGRDKCRTPLQWKDAANAGFCPAGRDPWLPVNPNFAQGVNVEGQEQNPGSLLNYYRRAIAFRNAQESLRLGTYQVVPQVDPRILAFQRNLERNTSTVILNFSSETVESPIPPPKQQLCFSTRDQNLEAIESLLKPFEGRIYIHQEG